MTRIVMAWVFSAAVVSVFFFAAPARADDCKPPRLMDSVDMTPVADGTRMTVPVSINGVTKHLLIETAGGASSLTAAAGEALTLNSHYSENARLLDSDGNATHHYFVVDRFQLGVLHVENMPLMVTPDPDLGRDPPFDGVLAADLMDYYDVEIDFAAHKLNYFSQDHCDGRVVYWPATAIGVAPITIRKRDDDIDMARSAPVMEHLAGLQISGKGDLSNDRLSLLINNKDPPLVSGVDIRTTVMLDGKTFTANIDTGVETSTLNTDTARTAYDVTADSPGSTPAGRLIENDSNQNPGNAPWASETVIVNGTRIFEHTFHTLSFGGVTVTNPLFIVRPDLTGANDPDNLVPVAGGHIARADDVQRPDITIGMNVLRRLHLYFAFKEGKLYITSADPPPQPPG